MYDFTLIFGLITSKVNMRTFLQDKWVFEVIWMATCNNIRSAAVCDTPGGEGGTAIYGLHKYVQL